MSNPRTKTIRKDNAPKQTGNTDCMDSFSQHFGMLNTQSILKQGDKIAVRNVFTNSQFRPPCFCTQDKIEVDGMRMLNA
jgi:hypothetical protein